MLNSPLRTTALVLRHFAPTDAKAVMELNGEETTRAWLPSHVYPTLKEAVLAVEYLIAQYSAPGTPKLGPYVLGVEHAASGRLLGHVGFSPLEGAVEVSYAIAEDSRGRAYGAEALVAACEWASASFGLDQVVALTSSANAASRRTLARAAFCQSGEQRMHFQGLQQWVSLYTWRPRPRTSFS